MTHGHEHKHADEGCDDCGCGHDHGDEYSMEDLVFGLYQRLDALIALMIEKKVFTEAEFEKKVEDSMEEELSEDGEEAEAEEE